VSLEPFENPIGFGAADFFELLIAALLVAFAFTLRPWIEPLGEKLAKRAGWSMLLLAALPVVLRLALLPNHPVPAPAIYDEFGHLLVADTLRHLRLANPAHAMHRFFETFFALQEPTYSSIYPIGQGLALAAGRAISGAPWAGVLLSTAAFCSLSYWMLRGWTTPAWSLIGGILAVIEFGPLNPWMNNYWGGSLAAAAGCLVFGALPRLRDRPSLRDAILLGCGLALSLIVRPYESIFLGIAVLAFLFRPKTLALAAIPVLAAFCVTLLQNHSVTGHWTTLPYQLSQYQYGVPAALTFQRDPIPHRDLTPQQDLEYKSQLAFRGSERETLKTYLLRLEFRVRYYRFFFLPALYVALPFFLCRLRDLKMLWVAATLALFAAGTNFFPAFQLHYLAPVACLFLLVSVAGLERLSRLRWSGQEAAGVIVLLCVAHFALWYGVHFFDTTGFSQRMRREETWPGLNHRNPDRRSVVNAELASMPGKLLVFVRYWPQHIFQDEWVYNEAAIDASRIVWARDLGPEENEKLRAYYPDRAALLLEPDARPPRLEPCR
jgi:hypothetical protein